MTEQVKKTDFRVENDAAMTESDSSVREQALNQERAKFQQETRRTSELTSLLRRWVERHEAEHEPGPWSRSCMVCELVGESRELLARPVNVDSTRTAVPS